MFLLSLILGAINILVILVLVLCNIGFSEVFNNDFLAVLCGFNLLLLPLGILSSLLSLFTYKGVKNEERLKIYSKLILNIWLYFLFINLIFTLLPIPLIIKIIMLILLSALHYNFIDNFSKKFNLVISMASCNASQNIDNIVSNNEQVHTQTENQQENAVNAEAKLESGEMSMFSWKAGQKPNVILLYLGGFCCGIGYLVQLFTLYKELKRFFPQYNDSIVIVKVLIAIWSWLTLDKEMDELAKDNNIQLPPPKLPAIASICFFLAPYILSLQMERANILFEELTKKGK